MCVRDARNMFSFITQKEHRSMYDIVNELRVIHSILSAGGCKQETR